MTIGFPCSVVANLCLLMNDHDYGWLKISMPWAHETEVMSFCSISVKFILILFLTSYILVSDCRVPDTYSYFNPTVLALSYSGVQEVRKHELFPSYNAQTSWHAHCIQASSWSWKDPRAAWSTFYVPTFNRILQTATTIISKACSCFCLL